ncbi:MAG: tetratricopeptide repeat protein, partial [Myxococcales bacterium]|nr:tetratricopeptide repeat protein [Myxococcales bacterium]
MLWLLTSACFASAEPEPEGAPASAPLAVPAAPTTVSIPPADRTLRVPVPIEVLDQMRAGAWEEAYAGLEALPPAVGDAKSDLAFLVGWAAIHTDHPERAVEQLGALDGPHTAPDAFVDLVRGELTLASGDALGALAILDQVADGELVGARAAMDAHRALRDLSREKEAWERLERLVSRPDPAPGNAAALLALAEHHGLASEAARPYVVRIRTSYPGSPEDLAVAAVAATHPLDWTQRVLRAEQWMAQRAYTKAIEETNGLPADAVKGDSVDACRYRYVRGRSQTRKNLWSDAAATMADAAKACVNAEGDYGPRAAYLRGTALSRVKRYREAADAYAELTALYPEHSMADDGLTRGGIALREAGQEAQAREAWERAAKDFPTGDTVPEALFRLAYARYEAGDTADAIALARTVGALPIDGDALHVAAGRYWAARWLVYADPSSPTTPTTDDAAKARAIDEWRSLCREMPQSFWSILAWSRLKELAPEVAAELTKRPEGHDDGSTPVAWDVRPEVAQNPRVEDAVALFRVGLAGEALEELAVADLPELTPDERAWFTELRIAAGDWLFAHDEMRTWIKAHPLGTLGPHEPQIQRVAYPDRYWSEVQASVKSDWDFDPRLFHGLVREESNFN